ncbi:helix-turn-helix transcriptional regulator [Metabacillus halosaccharovorans]|uniref:helix-turn-helix transcriptional regulator n=1 Tax=Metabacillus halosaccharovorans TaxID=930124 RepID=UPI002040E5BE|nr:YafY family protein [Metabacillus halosaccharovorans]MCM3439262.1 YafY family transcriptional regulator [Metabacillus halosaccharovorans]
MAKSKRLLDILMFVTAKKKFTAQEIADEFQISIRTVHRYIIDLCDIGLPIYAEQGRNGGYTVLTSSFLPPILFTEEEAVSIFFSFQSLKYYRSLPFDAEITSVEHKLYNSLQSEAKTRVDKIRSHIAFWNPKRTIDSPLLNEMLEYSIGNRDVHIQYESKTGIREKHIRPIGVYAHDGLWYLPAYDYDKKKILLLRVDRILSIISNKKSEAEFMSLEEWFDFHEVKKPIRLHVHLTMEGVRQCKSVPYFEGFVVTQEDGTGYIDTIIDKGELGFITPLFLRLGRHARILEPMELIDGLRKQAEEILTMYQD